MSTAAKSNPTPPDGLARLRKAFQSIWGYSDFRAPQGEIAQAILNGQDIITVMPTGSGKSICFQLPALIQDGVTLVVSPLVALMENQVQELKEKRLPAAALHSEMGKRERSHTLQRLAQNHLRLLYLSPETLLSRPVWEILNQPQIKINALVLDEAHCLTQWGDSFRPTYRRLGAVRSALLANRPKGSKIAIAAFTATADPTTQKALHTVLQLQKPKIIRLNPYRSNLRLAVRVVWTPKGRQQALAKFVQRQGKRSGLIYARTRRGTEDLAKWFAAKGYRVKAYHGGLSATRRRQIESEWIEGDCQFVICTSAFGMGINKPDCRFVAHYEVPSLISEYVQEVGRGGRDGRPAVALSLVSEPTGLLSPEDKQRWKFFEQKAQQLQQSARQLVKQIPSSGNIDDIRSQFKNCDQAIALLHRDGQLQWKDPFNYQIQTHHRRRTEPAISAAAVMQRYLFTKRCRWQVLLEEFGFAQEAKSMRCGQCDRCRKG
ncbi:ATP-dependent DNA helicase RecQ [cf. Phormidesmis sp. LEGE 11477]|uniref:RecQ family ATP-dependent DNA helicase n=1 Tax=cf. Phormidesmis sp. LEGE 11477 TaxID=1828680 RepID=UPI00187EFCFC|nr:RecQ family ATP-dependent DNA helicase [cf. Phormidesmis sp. LEGE 11477]MBE9060934.1 ATP-dependent DNA helicase RecQ [cf. Phormidesmis sp. LEGE 11477]